MSHDAGQKRKRAAGAPKKVVSKQKRLKRAAAYHSSSSDDEDDSQPSNKRAGRTNIADEDLQLANVIEAPSKKQKKQTAPSNEEAETSDEDLSIEDDEADEQDDDGDIQSIPDSDADESSEDEPTEGSIRKKPKRADPDALATSIDKILNSKLTTQKRADPVLSRSKAAQQSVREKSDAKLEQAARRKMRAEKTQAREQGHVKDVLGLQTTAVSTGEVLEEERRLKKLAQRGVVKLFNAVRMAQVGAQEATVGSQRAGMVGIDRRKERVDEMSKKGFLDLLNGGEA